MATRKDFETIIDLASRALNAGNDLGIFAAEKSNLVPAGVAEAMVDVAAAALPSTKDMPPVKAMVNQNPDLAYDLTPDQIDGMKRIYVGLIADIQATAAGL